MDKTDDDPTATVFEYVRPAELERAKSVAMLCRSDIVTAMVQIVREGGENNLHSHSASDGFWMVLAGEARFYDEDGILAELSTNQGVLIPRRFKYWFESCGGVPLEILHVSSKVPGSMGDDRTDHEQQKAATTAAYEQAKAADD